MCPSSELCLTSECILGMALNHTRLTCPLGSPYPMHHLLCYTTPPPGALNFWPAHQQAQAFSTSEMESRYTHGRLIDLHFVRILF